MPGYMALLPGNRPSESQSTLEWFHTKRKLRWLWRHLSILQNLRAILTNVMYHSCRAVQTCQLSRWLHSSFPPEKHCNYRRTGEGSLLLTALGSSEEDSTAQMGYNLSHRNKCGIPRVRDNAHLLHPVLRHRMRWKLNRLGGILSRQGSREVFTKERNPLGKTLQKRTKLTLLSTLVVSFGVPLPVGGSCVLHSFLPRAFARTFAAHTKAAPCATG